MTPRTVLILIVPIIYISIINGKNISSYAQDFSNSLKSLMCDGLSVGGAKCNNTNYGVQDFINSFTDHLHEEINASIIVEQIIQRVNAKLNLKASMLKNISSSINSICNIYKTNNTVTNDYLFNELYNVGNANMPSNLPKDMKFVPIYGLNVSLTSTVLWLPHYVDHLNINVQKDAIISELMTEVIVDMNKKNCIHSDDGDIEYCQMYFGSINGVFRGFPAVQSEKNSDGSFPNFDPRLRPWFFNAVSGSHHTIIILIEMSDLIKQNDKLSQLKTAVKTVLNILPLSSWVTVIAFNDNVILPCFGIKLVQASSRNIKQLINFVTALSASGYANYTKAFNTAYDIFDAFEGNRCHSSILFVTCGNDKISDITKDIENRTLNINNHVTIFSYGFGDNNYNMNIAQKMAKLTNGVYKMIIGDEYDNILGVEMSLFYLYYAYSKNSMQQNIPKITSPYLDFETGVAMITMSMCVFYNKYLIGVLGIDIPLSYFSNAIGDIIIGRKSYYFIMNQYSELVLHPNINDSQTNNNIYEPIYVTDEEPKEFDTTILPLMIRRQTGFLKIEAKITHGYSNVEYYGFSEEIAHLLYLYFPIGPCCLSMAIVVHSTQDLEAPMLHSNADLNIKLISDIKCNFSSPNYKPISECISPFNLYHECVTQRMLSGECNSYWNKQAEIINSTNSDYDLYGGVPISLKYAMFLLQPGLWENEYNAKSLIYQPACQSLELFHNLSNNIRSNISAISNDLPYDGLRNENAKYVLNSIYSLTSLHWFWKDAYLSHDSPFFHMYFATYFGFHTSYPAIKYPKAYNPLIRPWYQRASSFPDKFVFTTPYVDAPTGFLILSGATVMYVPYTKFSLGVLSFDFTYSVFVSFWKTAMSKICDFSVDFSNVCYLLDSSAFLLLFDGMENKQNDKDISIKFFGDQEPTLMQSLLDRKFFINNTYINAQTDQIVITYIVNEKAYNTFNMSSEKTNFVYNKGVYTVHKIIKTNLWLIRIENYKKTRIYPWQCPNDFFTKCKDVYSPGCLKNNNNECISAT
eukprot:331137_1